MLIKRDMVLCVAMHEKAGKATKLRSCFLDGIGTDLSLEMPEPVQITFSSIEVIFELRAAYKKIYYQAFRHLCR